LGAHLAADTLPAVWVLELSSFQLADSVPAVPALAGAPAAFEPSAATVLNITQDHLDWHGDMAAYAQAKALVFGQRALMVLNQDDALVMALRAPAAKGRPQRACICFGAGMPLRAGDFGIEQVNGMAWLVRAMELDPTIKLRKGQEAEELHIQRMIPAEALRIRGRHNAVNALAALALAASTGCTLAPLLFGLREYQGEPHRVESIGVVGDVEYFDDSKGTNVGATVAALNGLGPERRLIPILGGDGKGQDFTPLAAPVARYARAVVLIGRDGTGRRDFATLMADLRGALRQAGVTP
jgi:UDP-N-acetylmuramoylalanine--D-glutamate ligase